jgi:hypothetical protein
MMSLFYCAFASVYMRAGILLLLSFFYAQTSSRCSNDSLWCSVARQIYSQSSHSGQTNVEVLFEQLLSETPSMAMAILKQLQSLVDRKHVDRTATSHIASQDICLLLMISRATRVSDNLMTSDEEFEIPSFFSSQTHDATDIFTCQKVYFATLFYQMLLKFIDESDSSTASAVSSSEKISVLTALVRGILFGDVHRSMSWLATLRCKEIISYSFYCINYYDVIQQIVFQRQDRKSSNVLQAMIRTCVSIIYQDILECQNSLLQTLVKATSVLLSRVLSLDNHPRSSKSSGRNHGTIDPHSMTSKLTLMLNLLTQLSNMSTTSFDSSSSASVAPSFVYSAQESYAQSQRTSLVSSVFVSVMQEQLSLLMSLSSRCTRIPSMQDWMIEMFPRFAQTSSEFFVNLLNYIRKSLFQNHQHSSMNPTHNDQRVFFIRLLVTILFQHPEESYQLQITQTLLHAFTLPLQCRRYLYVHLQEGLYASLSSSNKSYERAIAKSALTALLQQIQLQLGKALVSRKSHRKKRTYLPSSWCSESLEVDFENIISTIKTNRSIDSDEDVYYVEEDIRQLITIEGLATLLSDPQRALEVMFRIASSISNRSCSDESTFTSNMLELADSTTQTLINHLDAILVSMIWSSSSSSSDTAASKSKSASIETIIQLSIQAACIQGFLDIFYLCAHLSSSNSASLSSSIQQPYEINASPFDSLILDLQGALDILFDAISSSMKDGSIKSYTDLDMFISYSMSIGISDLLLPSSSSQAAVTVQILSEFYDNIALESFHRQITNIISVNERVVKEKVLGQPYSILFGGMLVAVSSIKRILRKTISSQMLADIRLSCCRSYHDVIRYLSNDGLISTISQSALQERLSGRSNAHDSSSHRHDLYIFTTAILSYLEQSASADLQLPRRLDLPSSSSSSMNSAAKNRYVKSMSESLKLQLLAAKAELLEVIALNSQVLLDFGDATVPMHVRISSHDDDVNFDEVYWAFELRDSIQHGLSLRSYNVSHVLI